MNQALQRSLNRVLNHFIFEQFSDTSSQNLLHNDSYQKIFETRPIKIPDKSNLELHVLVCERDFLRSFWALKSFFYYSNLPTKLVIQDDGSLTSQSHDRYYEHFPGCIVNSNNDNEVHKALTGYPMCQFFLGHHPIAKKLFHPLLVSTAEYLIVMDSDILWFKHSRAINQAVQKKLPFYVDGKAEAYVRNREFMEQKLNLYPAVNVNSGIIGYPRSRFLDLQFIESAIRKLVLIPKNLVPQSVGYTDTSVNLASNVLYETLCWWVMEQTVYALLLGRESQRRCLEAWSEQCWKRIFGDLHQFTRSPIFRGTVLVHYISDSSYNQFFPAGVQHLIKRGFIEKLSN